MTDWIKVSIVNYGPVTIGFAVFDSFMNFFANKQNAKKVYTAQQFLQDMQRVRYSLTPKGGHAVVITGWSKIGNIKFWIVRNSWGLGWADNGYFRIEQDIDAKLARYNVRAKINFENEFGALYFVPSPTSSSTPTSTEG